MIDTHTHLDYKSYDNDRGEVFSRAFASGVRGLINVGDNFETSLKSIQLASQNEKSYAAVGMHPYEFNDLKKIDQQQKDVEKISVLAREKKVVAIGEIGLDYHSHTKEPINLEQKRNQKKGFLAQLEIASHFQLPVIIHCRDAYEEVYELIVNCKLSIIKSVLHCYAGNVEITKKFLKLPKMFFSFTGNITYLKPVRTDFLGLTEKEKKVVKTRSERDRQILEVLQLIPMEKIMVETDGPFLTPVPFRGKRNEPAYLKYVLEKLAEIKGLSFDEAEKITDQNAKEFFGINF